MRQQSFDCRRCPKRRRLFDVARLDNQRGFRHFRRTPKCPHEHAPLQKSDFRTSPVTSLVTTPVTSPVTELACGQCAQAVRGFTAAMSLGSVCCAESSAGRCRRAHVANFCSAYGKRRPVKVTLLVAASSGRTQVKVDACCTLPRWIPVTHKSPTQILHRRFLCVFSLYFQ